MLGKYNLVHKSLVAVSLRERERKNRKKEERKKKNSLHPWKAIYNETITNNYWF